MSDNDLTTIDNVVYGVLMSELFLIKGELNTTIPQNLRAIRSVEIDLLERILDRAKQIMTDLDSSDD